MVKKALTVVVLLLISLAVYLYLQVKAFPDRVLSIQEEQVLTVAPGMTGSAFAALLEREGWVDDARWFRLVYRLYPEFTAIKSGEYQLNPGLSVRELFEIVTSGRSIQYRITLVEGSTVAEILTQLRETESLLQTLESADASALAAELGLDQASAEGMFLAETYQFERGTSDRELLSRAHKLLANELEQAWAERASDLPLSSSYDALILASIIEKETGLASERPEIAGVFVRRLNRGMRLQTDPTVIYGMGERYRGNITRADLRRPTPYNTYVISGLPPTPIATVGREAIKAAVNPADGTALYFVARGDGSHQFSDTLAQHNRAVREYQLQRRSDYRSSPQE